MGQTRAPDLNDCGPPLPKMEETCMKSKKGPHFPNQPKGIKLKDNLV